MRGACLSCRCLCVARRRRNSGEVVRGRVSKLCLTRTSGFRDLLPLKGFQAFVGCLATMCTHAVLAEVVCRLHFPTPCIGVVKSLPLSSCLRLQLGTAYTAHSGKTSFVHRVCMRIDGIHGIALIRAILRPDSHAGTTSCSS